ncbi:unnamed protein product [Gadus morhua 'NCC']
MAPRLSAKCPPISLIGVRSVLSVAGWWVTVVSAIQDQPSGWSGPRFKWRAATLLHPLSKPRVDGQWKAAVYAVLDYTSDPPGPRFTGRDATICKSVDEENVVHGFGGLDRRRLLSCHYPYRKHISKFS